MLEEARVYFDEGYIFGEEGAGFERMNIACSRSLLQEALERIRLAVQELGSAQA
jgi:cystathionine beta-lyase